MNCYWQQSLIECEFKLWKCFHVRLSNTILYDLPWSLSICVHLTIELNICLHVINYNSWNGIFPGMFTMFRFRFSGWYLYHRSPYWCCVWTAVKSQCGKKCWGSLGLNLELYVDVVIHLLTVVGLTPCGSKSVHIYTQTVYWCVDTFVHCSCVDTKR